MRGAATRRALLLLNPKARRGQEPIRPILKQLEAGGISVHVEAFEALPEIARDIVRLRHIADLVIVCGGDGSVSSAALAAMESGLHRWALSRWEPRTTWLVPSTFRWICWLLT